MAKIIVSSSGGSGATGPAGAGGAAGAAGATGATGPAASGLYTVDLASAYVDAFGAASAFDQEFNRTTPATALPTTPATWVYQNQNSATYREELGMGKISIASGYNTLDKLTCVVQPVSAASAYTAIAKVSLVPDAAVDFSPGLCITDGTKAIMIWGTADLQLVSRWTDINGTYTDNVGSVTQADDLQYLKVVKTSASSYAFYASRDGTNWLTVLAGYDVGAFMTPTHFGFGYRQPTGACKAAFDWFRVR